jgi:two-component system, response regulator
MPRPPVILLVEDNADDAELTIRGFRRSNLANEIVRVEDGVEALDYLFGAGVYAGRDVGEQPQVVLLDLKLPKIDGIEVLKAIRADPRTTHLPVVVLTSSDEPPDIAAAYAKGANSYVCKPVKFEEFVEATQHLGLYWLVLNQPIPRSLAVPAGRAHERL